jgi:serine/threonine-protein kinase
MVSTQWIEQHFPQLSNLQPLAKGGQKEVFSARHAVDGDVVLKLITPSSDGGERVRREILAVQQVKSARVPQVKEAGVLTSPEGRELVWLREEKILGESVRETVSRGPLQKDDVVRLGLHVLEALADAERARIVHRDVKPDNIIRGVDGQFWLLDFGIARFLDLTSLTATAFGGPATIGYAPPEQYRNHKREIDARADLFALGVTMVECLVGRNAFRHGARDAQEVVRRIENTPLTIAPITGDTNGALADYLRTLTQRRLDCRPESAAEALKWLKEVAGQP